MFRGKRPMMLRRTLWMLVLGIIAMGAPCQQIYSANTGSSPGISPAPSDEITVSAAISLKDALDEISRPYTSEHAGAEVHFNLGGSGTLQRQIEQGAPVDIFISASPKEMDSVQSQGLLLTDTRKDLVRNSVVLIVPCGKREHLQFSGLDKSSSQNGCCRRATNRAGRKIRAGSAHTFWRIRPTKAETRAREGRPPGAQLRRDRKRRCRNRICHRCEDIEEGSRGSDCFRGLAFACGLPCA